MDRDVEAVSKPPSAPCGTVQKGNESSSFSPLDHINDGPFILLFVSSEFFLGELLPLSLLWSPPTNFPWKSSQSQKFKITFLIYRYPMASRVSPFPLHPPYLPLQECLSTDHRCCLELTSVLLSCSFSVLSLANFFFLNKSYRYAEKPEMTEKKKKPAL